MKILYLDCTNGISGDMLLKALSVLGRCEAEVVSAMEAADFGEQRSFHHSQHGRSFNEVKHIIADSGFTEKARKCAVNIYSHIAEAEAEVHGESIETIHFHEVGRDQAIKNALGIGMALDIIAPDKVEVSAIYDGKGTVVCSHGKIPVPVPAVRALMKRSTLTFRQADVDTEMVTPSGLAGLMGIGARQAAPEHIGSNPWNDLQDNNGWSPVPELIISQTEARGGRDTGRGGLKAYILETGGTDEA